MAGDADFGVGNVGLGLCVEEEGSAAWREI